MGSKLLLADDSITIQKVVGIIFANEDYELTVVDNGNAALEKAREIVPDIMLVDALMPGKSGYEVCEAVRRDPLLKHTPLLLLTGAFEPFDEAKARRSGADDFISKPFESQHLIDKVQELIGLGRERASSAASAPAASLFPLEEGPAEVARETTLPFTEEAVEAAPEDDLWGVFELEDVEEEDGVEFGEVVEGSLVEPAVGMEAVEAFSFVEEEESAPAEMVEEPAVAEPSGFSVAWESAEEESFGFQEEEELPAVETTQVEAGEYFAAVPAASATGFPAGEPLPATAAGDVDRQFAPEEEYIPAIEAAPAFESQAPVAGVPAISEERLAAIVSQISREVIERIVWEVVPDLAETLIKEEIRRLKEGA